MELNDLKQLAENFWDEWKKISSFVPESNLE